MSVTSKGRIWEILHSLWIGWTFTIGLLNWVAFLYIGLRAKQWKWIVWGLVYSVPLLIMMSIGPPARLPSWLTTLVGFLYFGLWISSMVHAFLVRREYLLYLETLQRKARGKEAKFKQQLEAEVNEGEVASGQSGATVEKVDQVAPPPNSKESSGPFGPQAPPSPSALPKPSPPRIEAIPEQITAGPANVDQVLPKISSGDQLEYQISSSYPFPLAFGFRSLTSIVDARDLYREQLRVAENLLAFLASVSLPLLRNQDREKAEIDPAQYWLSGISPGDWKDIIGRCSKAFAAYEDNPLALAISRLSIRSEKKGFGKDVATLIRAKNDYKHDRGPVILEDIADAARETQETLKRCMEPLAFFIDHPIRQVEDLKVSRSGDEYLLKCLRYTGDHPSFPQEDVVFHRGLPEGDLYLELGNRSWVSLYPFIVTMNCAHCKAKETYFIDMWDQRRGTARMKSFERGHTMSNPEVSDALARWRG